MRTFLLLGSIFSMLFSFLALASCPDGQHEECVLPRLGGGCAQRICVKTIRVSNPLAEVVSFLQKEADSLAAAAKTNGSANDYSDCVPMVAAGVAAAGAKLGAAGGPWGAAAGAALGAGGGVNMARISCRRWFPKHTGEEE